MYISNDMILYGLLVVPVLFLFVVNRINHSKSNSKVQIYQDKIVFLNETIKQLKEKKQPVVRETTYTKHEDEKKEKLLQKIETQKIKIQELSSLAKESMKTKYDFISNMRHEVRTPLNSILVFSELLKNSLSDKKLIEFAKNISASGNNLLVFIDKIIELGEVELGYFKKNEGAVEIDTFLKDLVPPYRSKAKTKGLLFTLEIDEKIPNSLILDKDKIRTILVNILENAIKFTNYGSIRIYLNLISSNKIHNSVDIAFVIKDSGKGISEKHQKSIFDIFEKKEDGTAHEYQSTGLGLSVNKKVAQMIDGDLSVISQLDKGSEFTLSLNNLEIVLANQHEDIDESSINFKLIKPEGATIAIIDTQKQNIKLLEDSFKSTNTKVLSFIDTREAIHVLMQQKIDLLFIDINILTMDDGAVSQVIKSSLDVPVVSLVSGRMKDIEFNTNGVIPVSHIKKPISRLELFKSCLTTLNSQEINIKEKTIEVINDSILDKDIDIAKLNKFLKQTKIKLNILFDVASSSNDLNAMKVFATSLLELSDVYSIVSMKTYAETLLEKIEIFDIEAINSLMGEYEVKLQKLYEIK